MPGQTRRGGGNPRKSDLNPHKVSKHDAYPFKLKNKRAKKKKKEEERRKYWKSNKQWQEVDKPKLMKRLKKENRLHRQLRKQGKLCACKNKNFTQLVIEKGKTIEKCTFCNKLIKNEKEKS